MKGCYLNSSKKASRVTVMWISLILATMAWGSVQSPDFPINNEYIVRVSESSGLYEFAALAGGVVEPLISYPDASQEVLDAFGNYYVVSVSSNQQSSMDSLVNALSRLSVVQHLEINTVVNIDFGMESGQQMLPLDDPEPGPHAPDDPFFSYQWDKVVTETDWAWSTSTGSADVLIAILDTGVDPEHADLEPNLVPGYNFIDDDVNVVDDNGHGTKVAGVAAARINNAAGIAGVAGNASIMPLKVANSMGNIKRSDLVAAIVYAADNTVSVINVSAGFFGPSEAEKAAVEFAWEKGLCIVASAGNDDSYDLNHYPSTYEHVMSVGASTQDDARVDFSNYGENVDVYAPGKSVWVTLTGDGYGTATGTSYASPQVAGLAALVMSAYPEYSNQQVWDVIIAGADTIDTDKGKVLRINSRKAVEMESDSETETGIVAETGSAVFVSPVSSIQKGTLSFNYEVTQATDYTLRIFDAAGKAVYVRDGNAVSQGRIECAPELPEGAYFWIFLAGQGVASGKVVFLK